MRIVVLGLVVTMILSFNGITVERAIAKVEGIVKDLTPITIVEEFYGRRLYNNDRIYKRHQDKENLNFLKINVPIYENATEIKDETAIEDNLLRFALFYQCKYIPSIVIDGTYEGDQDRTEEKRKQLIIDSITKHLNYATITLKDNQNGSFELGITGMDEKLKNYPTKIVSVYLIENIVNCDFTFGEGEKIYTTSLNNVLRAYPFTYKGKTVTVLNGKTANYTFQANIPSDRKNNYSIVVMLHGSVLSNIGSKTTLATGYISLASTDPAKFIWNNMPDNPFFGKSDEEALKYVQKIGFNEMKLYIENPNDLQYLRFKIAQTAWERERYMILGAKINPELKAKKFEFNQNTREVNIELEKPITSKDKIEIVTIITHCIKTEELKISCSFQFQDFIAKNSKQELIYCTRQDIIRRYPLQFLIATNPLDINLDAWLDQKDINIIIQHFGINSTDKIWNSKYDIDQTGLSKDRIDIADLVKMINIVQEEEKFKSQFHDNLKRIEIWESKNISICQIKDAQYGNEGKWINITKTLQDKLKDGDFEMRITSDNLSNGKDPDYGNAKKLKIIYDDMEQKDNEIYLDEWDTYKFKKECSSNQTKSRIPLALECN